MGRAFNPKDLPVVADDFVKTLDAPLGSRRALEEHVFILGVLVFEDLICDKNEQARWALRDSGSGVPALKDGEREIFFKSREFAAECARAVASARGIRPVIMEVA